MTMQTDQSELVCIKDVEGFSSGTFASSVHGSQARILQSLGDDLTYDDLICYSAFAFRIGVHEEMCPSAGHPCCGIMCIQGSNQAIPWQMNYHESFPWGEPKEDRAKFEAEVHADVKESIDRGVPVHYGSEEDGLIIGYAENGSRWRCLHPYHEQGRAAFWHEDVEGFAGGKWPWGVAVWTDRKPEEEQVSSRVLTIAALRQTLEMWKAEKKEAYFSGDAAYGHWLGWLRDVEAGKIENPKSGMQGNGWCYDVLVHSRRIAGARLNRKAGEFDESSARKLRNAAKHYSQITELCMQELDNPWELAPAPHRFDDWTSEMRQTQIDRLAAAREHDGLAVGEIERVIESLSASCDH